MIRGGRGKKGGGKKRKRFDQEELLTNSISVRDIKNHILVLSKSFGKFGYCFRILPGGGS